MHHARIEELGASAADAPPSPRRRSRALTLLACALALAAIGGILRVGHEREVARGLTSSCARPGVPATDVVRAFLQSVDDGDARATLSCWRDAGEASRWMDRLARTGGVRRIDVLNAAFDGAGPVRTARVLASPTWRIDADVYWPSGRPKIFLLHDAGEGRWRLAEIRTPMWDAGSCTDASLAPAEVVRTFFALLDERQVAGMEECLVAGGDFRDRAGMLSAYLATGGATAVAITANRELPDGAAVRVAVQWRVTPWTGECCERWFVLRVQNGHWRIAGVETALS